MQSSLELLPGFLSSTIEAPASSLLNQAPATYDSRQSLDGFDPDTEWSESLTVYTYLWALHLPNVKSKWLRVTYFISLERILRFDCSESHVLLVTMVRISISHGRRCEG